MPGLPVHHQLPEFTQTHFHRVGDTIQPSHPLSSPPPPAPIPPSIRVFSNESTLHMGWPKYWSFSFSISPSTEHPGLISFRMDWLDLPAVQGTLKSLLQHHSSKASILQRSAKEIRIKTTMRYHLMPVRKAIIEKATNSKCWRRCGEKGTLLHCWWEGNLVQPLERTVWRFLKKLEIELPYDPAIPLLGVYPEETRTERDTCTPIVHCNTFYNS